MVVSMMVSPSPHHPVPPTLFSGMISQVPPSTSYALMLGSGPGTAAMV